LNAKPHRQNSGFQLRHFLVGSCTTPDGAYVLMYGQLIDMQGKLRHAESQLKARQAKLKAAEAKEAKANFELEQAKDPGRAAPAHEVLQAEADALQAQADRLEIEADIPTWDMNFEAAQAELADIEKLMLELKPRCKYAHLPILEMSEKSQEEEWLGELKQRAENFLLTAGTIPHDHFQTMRMHPQFKTHLVPHIQIMHDKINTIGARYQDGPQKGQLVEGVLPNMAALMMQMEEPQLLLEG
jgi:hypothetical protein